MNRWILCGGALLWLLAVGCASVHSVDRAKRSDLEGEGSIVFTRPVSYVAWGTRSLSDALEITYERFSVNAAGQGVLEVGIRYRGTQHWYDFWAYNPERLTVAAQTNFYATGNGQAGGPPLYSTNRQTLVIRRGDTCSYQALCPRAGAKGSQLVLSEPGQQKRD